MTAMDKEEVGCEGVLYSRGDEKAVGGLREWWGYALGCLKVWSEAQIQDTCGKSIGFGCRIRGETGHPAAVGNFQQQAWSAGFCPDCCVPD